MSREIGQSRWYPWMINGALLVLALVSLAPLLWMVSVSFMPQGEASHFPPPLLPSSITTHNYHELFARTGMGGNFANSLLVSLAITLGSLLLNTMAGYAFAKLNFAGRERLFQVLMAALVIPAQVAMLPLFLLMKQLGLVNTWGGVVVPALASVFGIFLVRQYARSIPDELLEAARIDGAGEARIFFTIVLRLLAPAMVTIFLFLFVGTWNNFLLPLMMVSSDTLKPVTLGLYGMVSLATFNDRGSLMMGALLGVLPVIVIVIGYFFFSLLGFL